MQSWDLHRAFVPVWRGERRSAYQSVRLAAAHADRFNVSFVFIRRATRSKAAIECMDGNFDKLNLTLSPSL